MSEEVNPDRVAELLTRFSSVSRDDLISLASSVFRQRLCNITREMLLKQIIDQVGFEHAVQLLEELTRRHEEAMTPFQPVPVSELISRQFKFPVYLTNACCDNANGSLELCRLLNLSFGTWDTADNQVRDLSLSDDVNDALFYPLSRRESQYIFEDIAPIGRYYALMGYSVIYCKRKYLFPSVEITYLPVDAAADEKAEFSSQQDALQAIRSLSDQIKPAIDRIGGFVWVFEGDEREDRHTLGIAIPFDFAYRLGDNYNAVKQWLHKLVPLPLTDSSHG